MNGLRINLKTKFTGASILLALILCVAIVAVSFVSYRNSMLDRYTESITSLVKTAAQFIPADKVTAYVEGGSADEDYALMQREFRILQQKSGLEYLYSYVPYPDGMTVLVQGTSPGDEGHYDLGFFADINVYPASEIEYAYSLLTKPETKKIYTSTTDFGYLITAFEIVSDSAGNPVCVVGADMRMDKINEVLDRYLTVVGLLAAVIIALFITLYLVFLRKNMINPLQVIVDSAIKFVGTGYSSGGKLVGMNLDIRTGDEIEDLAAAFNKMTGDIVKYINELTKVTSERERVETELRVARLIQEGMLPQEFSFPWHPEFQIFASMRAAKDVGGDFYDFFFIGQDRLCFVVGDVSGKGIPAALFMAMAKATVRDLALQGFSVDEVLSKTNAALCKNNEQGMFVTLHIAILNLKTGELVWSDAGHSPAILWAKSGELMRIDGKKGFVLGGMEDYAYSINRGTVPKGSIIFLYTDGITDAVNEKMELYSETRMFSFIKNYPVHHVKSLCEDLLADVDKHAGKEPQFDDITMLAIEYRGAE